MGHIIVYVGNWCGVTIVFYGTFVQEDFGEDLGPWAHAISILARQLDWPTLILSTLNVPPTLIGLLFGITRGSLYNVCTQFLLKATLHQVLRLCFTNSWAWNMLIHYYLMWRRKWKHTYLWHWGSLYEECICIQGHLSCVSNPNLREHKDIHSLLKSALEGWASFR